MGKYKITLYSSKIKFIFLINYLKNNIKIKL